MIVFDLKCAADHVFEAWFGSSADYETQKGRGLVQCPLCGSDSIEKAVMAPAVSPKGNSRAGDPIRRKQELQQLMALQAEVESRCDYVGNRFAEEARARHLDTPEDTVPKGIYGEATIAEAVELLSEGITVAPLPFRPKRLADA